MKSKRCDCVKSEDLRKAIESLKKLSANFEKVLRCNGLSFALGRDSIFDVALSPFDKVANGSVLKARDCDVVEFVQCWMGIAKLFACGDKGNFYLVLALFNVGNGFIGATDNDFGRGVFIADYGYFRAMLVRSLYEKMNKIGGGLSEHELILENKKSIGIVKRKAEEAALAACGEWGDKECKTAQVIYAVDLYEERVKNGRVEGSTMNHVLTKATSVKVIFEHEIKTGFGYPKYNSKSGANDFYQRVRRELKRRGILKVKR